MGYAESQDGFHWTLPNLGLVNYNGSTDNNICRIARTNAEGIAVIHDPQDPAPDRRYKAFYWEHGSGNRPDQGITDISVNGMSVSFSADGKKWSNHPHNPVIALGSDTGQQAIYDPTLKKYVVFGRFGAGGRKIARAESDDFVHWSSPRLVLQADPNDGPRTQIYGMGITLYEGQYIGLPWMFHEGNSWKIDAQLATSRDGIHWTRVAQGTPFLPNGSAESWDAGIIFTASQPLQVAGDQVFIFYSASRHDHNYTQRPTAGTPEWDEYWENIKCSTGVATLRRDGFISLDAPKNPGTVVTKTFQWPTDQELYVNVDASSGSLQVEVVDDKGQPVHDSQSSQTITGDQLRAKIKWPNAPTALPAKIRLKFTILDASLYSFWFR